MADSRKPYPSDVSDDEWSLVVPYLTLMTEEAPQREYPLRELFNGLRYVVRYGIAWRAMPNDLPSCPRFTSKPSVGWLLAVSRHWRRICGPYCGARPVALPIRPPPSSTVGP